MHEDLYHVTLFGRDVCRIAFQNSSPVSVARLSRLLMLGRTDSSGLILPQAMTVHTPIVELRESGVSNVLISVTMYKA